MSTPEERNADYVQILDTASGFIKEAGKRRKAGDEQGALALDKMAERLVAAVESAQETERLVEGVKSVHSNAQTVFSKQETVASKVSDASN